MNILKSPAEYAQDIVHLYGPTGHQDAIEDLIEARKSLHLPLAYLAQTIRAIIEGERLAKTEA